ncbi:MAG: RHS repeat-associated core domain-containing protein [Bacteroidales bacterium]|nr:RHS repeat-associated core domain-containing protein [Bacteroidales bacterium]
MSYNLLNLASQVRWRAPESTGQNSSVVGETVYYADGSTGVVASPVQSIPHWELGERYQHFGARAYDPLTCTFLQTDPLAEKYYGTSPYAYCGSNPVMFVDPDGEEKILKVPVKHTNLRLSAISFPDDDAIHIFAHGNGRSIDVDNGMEVANGDTMNMFLEENSKTWKEHEDKSNLVVVLHTCFGSSIAKKISSDPIMKGVIFVGASDYVHVNADYTESVLIDSNDHNSTGCWVIYANGDQVGSMDGNQVPSNENVLKSCHE